MFNHANFDRFFFAIAERHIKGLLNHMVDFIELEVRPLAFANEIEAIANENTNEFPLGSVLDVILSNKFELAVVVLGVKPDAPFRKRNP